MLLNLRPVIPAMRLYARVYVCLSMCNVYGCVCMYQRREHSRRDSQNQNRQMKIKRQNHIANKVCIRVQYSIFGCVEAFVTLQSNSKKKGPLLFFHLPVSMNAKSASI